MCIIVSITNINQNAQCILLYICLVEYSVNINIAPIEGGSREAGGRKVSLCERLVVDGCANLYVLYLS